MRKVRNRRCIAEISRKSMLANKKRCLVLLTAIALTTMMLTTLLTISGSMIRSMEMSTMYQVGTRAHAGFKFLTEEEFTVLKEDPEVLDLSYNIIVGNILNEEVYEDYTELRYTTKECAEDSFSLPTEGRLPEKSSEIAACTKVLDDFHIPHESGKTLHLKISNGIDTYEGDFTICGIWEKPAESLTNQIYVSKDFQERFSPAWKNETDKTRYENAGSFAGSINPGFYFKSSFNISGQMNELKARCGFDDEVNEGVNWAYSTSTLDFTSTAIAVCLLLLIVLSGYLIIYNVFYIAVSSEIHYYGLLKTVGTTNKQLKRIVVRQGSMLSMIAVPIGLIAGYAVSFLMLPMITASMTTIPCKVYPSVWIFLLSAAFSWITVRISCFKPCRIIKKISPLEAVNYSDYTIQTKLKDRKGHKVTPFTMAWENLKRSRGKNMMVILSIALSVIMVNVTVGITSSFDQESYIHHFASTDFVVSDGAMLGNNSQVQVYDAVAPDDIETLCKLDGVTDFGSIYFSESNQKLGRNSLKKAQIEFEEHPEWFILSEHQREMFEQELYEDHAISSHIYGIDKIYFDHMDVDAGNMNWDQFRSGRYAIISSPIETGKNDAKQAFYQIGEMIPVTLPDGSTTEYEVMAIADISYAMGPEHSHGLDINITIPKDEYLKCMPKTKGAMKCSFNVEADKMETIDALVSDYCENTKPTLGYKSRQTYLDDFQDMIHMFLLVGGILSLIIALIGVLNFINLTYTSINERKNELTVLRAVGMTRRQMSNMLMNESLIRVVITIAFVLTAGMIINYELIHLIAGQMFMFKFRFVIWPVMLSIPVLAAIAVTVSKLIIRQVKIV